MGTLRDRNTHDVGPVFAPCVHDGNAAVADLDRLAFGDRRFDVVDIEDVEMVAIGGHHALEVGPALGVVTGREGVFPVVIRRAEVHVAFDQDLPAHLHRLPVDGGMHGPVGLRVAQARPVIGLGCPELRITEHEAGVMALREDPVCTLGVRDIRDVIDFHRVAADTGESRAHLVVHVDIATVVGAILVGQVDMVRIAAGLSVQQILREIVAAPAGRGVAVEDRDALQLAHRGNAEDADFSRLPATPETVIVVELARRNVGRESPAISAVRIGRVGLGLSRGGFLLAATQGGHSDHTGSERGNAALEKVTSPAVLDLRVVGFCLSIGHRLLLLSHGDGVGNPVDTPSRHTSAWQEYASVVPIATPMGAMRRAQRLRWGVRERTATSALARRGTFDPRGIEYEPSRSADRGRDRDRRSSLESVTN